MKATGDVCTLSRSGPWSSSLACSHAPVSEKTAFCGPRARVAGNVPVPEAQAHLHRAISAPRLNLNPETGDTLCIACNLCALACPESLIVVGSERNEQTRRKELTTFTYDTSRCMFCGLCEDACPVDALELTQDFELAAYTREGAIWDRKMLEEGPKPAPYKY